MILHSSAVPWVTTGYVLIAVFVVSSDSGHELLSIRRAPALHLKEELDRLVSAKRSSQPSAVQYLDFTSLPLAEGETKIVVLRAGHVADLLILFVLKFT
ncbi:MAG TPA: hypothetical protein VIF60_19350 [Burkholderiaceae bacterium]